MKRGKVGKVAVLKMAVLLLAAAGACAPMGSRSTSASVARGEPVGERGAVPDDPAVTRFVELLSDRRAQLGCPPLAWDEEVAMVAAAHSRDMVERGYFAHVSPGGVDPFERLRAAGVPFVAAAENIAYGHTTGDGVFAQWSGSPGHRANMESCLYTRQGIGRHGSHWTQVLVRPPT